MLGIYKILVFKLATQKNYKKWTEEWLKNNDSTYF